MTPPPKRLGYPSVKMPGRITGMREVDGRLIVRLADGRDIDMTDWFSTKGNPQ
jgi:hypothetical protein